MGNLGGNYHAAANMHAKPNAHAGKVAGAEHDHHCGGMDTSTAIILVLFILLVIISQPFF